MAVLIPLFTQNKFIIKCQNSIFCRSQRPRCLRRGSKAAHLLGLRFRIPPEPSIYVSCECCVLSGRGLCDGLITRQRNAIECDVSQRELENSTRRRPWPAGAVEPLKKKLQCFTGSNVLKRFTVD
jgi:hypothetical protein